MSGSEKGRGLDAAVVGSGPNGLAAAIALAQAGASVRVFEASDEIGGGTRTAELTLPGFHHDVCSAVHTMGVLSPFFRQLPLEEHGLTAILEAEDPGVLQEPIDDAVGSDVLRQARDAGLGPADASNQEVQLQA